MYAIRSYYAEPAFELLLLQGDFAVELIEGTGPRVDLLGSLADEKPEYGQHQRSPPRHVEVERQILRRLRDSYNFV